MNIPQEQFDKYVEEAFDALPEDVHAHLNNVAVLVEDYPTKEQLGKTKLSNNLTLYGLFEGYAQSARLNFGAVLPDRITIFRKAIMRDCATEEEIKKQVTSTLKHEIAHHFGSGEKGAKMAGKIKS